MTALLRESIVCLAPGTMGPEQEVNIFKQSIINEKRVRPEKVEGGREDSGLEDREMERKDEVNDVRKS